MKSYALTIARLIMWFLIALFMWVAMWHEVNAYKEVPAWSTSEWINGQTVVTRHYNVFENECKEQKDYSKMWRIESKLTEDEIEFLRDAYQSAVWCGTFPTKTVCSEVFQKEISRQDAYCGDWNIDRNLWEECDSSTHCNAQCKVEIYKPKPIREYKPIIVDYMPPVWWCDLNDPECVRILSERWYTPMEF